MQVVGWARAAFIGLVMTSGLAAAAGGPALVAVARIAPGQWQLKPLDGDGPARSVCIGDARLLIQYGHTDAQCQHIIVANQTNIATVQYTCPGTGHGVTTFKVATPHNFNLETQGIVSGAPFDEQYEARRVGNCGGGVGSSR